MPLIKQKFINRCDLQDNPKVLYLFGDNTKRVGTGGQAGHMRGEANAIGIATKWAPGTSKKDYFNDKDFNEVIAILDKDLHRARVQLKNGDNVVIPSDGLGTGLSELPKRAPTINAWLDNELEELGLIGL